MHDLNHGHIAKTQNRITAPLLTDHSALEWVNLNLLFQCSAGGLQHVAMNLVLNTLRVDHQSCIVPNHHAFDMHFSGMPMHLHIGHPRGPSGTKARPLAVDVASVGKALAL